MNSKKSLLGVVALSLVIAPVLIPAKQTFGQEQVQQLEDDDIAPAPP